MAVNRSRDSALSECKLGFIAGKICERVYNLIQKKYLLGGESSYVSEEEDKN